MQTYPIKFFSRGEVVEGLVHRPDDEAPVPVLIQGPGWLGSMCSRISELFHPGFVDRGFAVLTFDYRGWKKDGPKVIDPMEQVADIISAVYFAAGDGSFRSDAIGIWGLGGTGGGNAIIAAALVPDLVKATVAQAVVARGDEWLRSMRRAYEWEELLRRSRENDISVASGGEDQLVDPTEEIMIATPHRKKAGQPTYGRTFGFSTVGHLLRYRPVDFVNAQGPKGLLLTALEGDVVAPPSHAEMIFERAPEPKALVTLRGVSHYDQFSTFRDELLDIFSEWLWARFDQPKVEVRAIARDGERRLSTEEE